VEPAAARGEVTDDELGVDEREEDLEDEDPDIAVRDSDDEIDVAGVVGPDGAVYSDADPGL
jgi:hypothetical protein